MSSIGDDGEYQDQLIKMEFLKGTFITSLHVHGKSSSILSTSNSVFSMTGKQFEETKQHRFLLNLSMVWTKAMVIGRIINISIHDRKTADSSQVFAVKKFDETMREFSRSWNFAIGQSWVVPVQRKNVEKVPITEMK